MKKTSGFKHLCLIGLAFIDFSIAIAQSNDQVIVTGDLDATFQVNKADSTYDNKTGFNAYVNAGIAYKGLEMGIRYEAFQPPLVGYKKAMEGQGFPFRFVRLTHENLRVTAGNFYTQFGEGIVLRAYEARGLGLDNSLDGIKIEYSIKNAIFLTAISGKQRHYFEPADIYKSTIRGVDAEINVSDLVNPESKFKVITGGSLVSRYFPAWKDAIAPDTLPPYVFFYSGRLGLQYKGIAFNTEIASKTKERYPNIGGLNDSMPRFCRHFNLNYTRKGIGVNLQYKETSAYYFISDPTQIDPEYFANFLPPLPVLYDFRLFNKYPYQTQYKSERGLQGEVTYTPKRGRTFNAGYSLIHDLKGAKLAEEGFVKTELKLSKNEKLTLAYKYQEINAIRVLINPVAGYIYSHTGAVESVYRFNTKAALRVQAQYLYTKQDKKDWTYELAEFTIAPHFTLAALDEYNIGSTKEHYLTGLVKYTQGNSQFTFSYGKTAAGTLCIGGVCRSVPEFNGFTFSVITKI